MRDARAETHAVIRCRRTCVAHVVCDGLTSSLSASSPPPPPRPVQPLVLGVGEHSVVFGVRRLTDSFPLAVKVEVWGPRETYMRLLLTEARVVDAATEKRRKVTIDTRAATTALAAASSTEPAHSAVDPDAMARQLPGAIHAR